jgi:hypothetical protein
MFEVLSALSIKMMDDLWVVTSCYVVDNHVSSEEPVV